MDLISKIAHLIVLKAVRVVDVVEVPNKVVQQVVDRTVQVVDVADRIEIVQVTKDVVVSVEELDSP